MDDQDCRRPDGPRMRSRCELIIVTNRYGLPFTNAQSLLFNVFDFGPESGRWFMCPRSLKLGLCCRSQSTSRTADFVRSGHTKLPIWHGRMTVIGVGRGLAALKPLVCKTDFRSTILQSRYDSHPTFAPVLRLHRMFALRHDVVQVHRPSASSALSNGPMRTRGATRQAPIARSDHE